MCVSCECCVFVRQRSLRRADHSSRVVLRRVISKPRQRGSLGPLRQWRHGKEKAQLLICGGPRNCLVKKGFSQVNREGTTDARHIINPSVRRCMMRKLKSHYRNQGNYKGGWGEGILLSYGLCNSMAGSLRTLSDRFSKYPSAGMSNVTSVHL